jgi:hypothetical protein
MDAKLILDAKATLGEGAMRHTRRDMQTDEDIRRIATEATRVSGDRQFPQSTRG